MIKNIIFDLGGVFIKIQYQKTSQAFKDLGITNFDDFFKQDFCNDLFEQLEVGKVNDIEFYTQFRALTNTNLTNHQIKDAWNAMLGSFWQDRLDWLEGISKRFNIFLFSNTNAIHYNAFMQQYHAENSTRKPLNNYFIEAYYSQNIGLRKPTVASYQYIIDEQKINPNETLFIDDTLKNIEGAKLAGLQTLHLTEDKNLIEIKF
ncbi:MAG: HAD family hydrolase [Chitinophagaceae bacterium]